MPKACARTTDVPYAAPAVTPPATSDLAEDAEQDVPAVEPAEPPPHQDGEHDRAERVRGRVPEREAPRTPGHGRAAKFTAVLTATAATFTSAGVRLSCIA